MSNEENPVPAFDPNGPGIKGNLFGLPYSPENASLVIVPVPWDVTVSYHGGTARAPEAVLQASSQIDLCLKNIPSVWKTNMAMMPVPRRLQAESHGLREFALPIITKTAAGETVDPDNAILNKVNRACENLIIYVKSITSQLLRAGKLVGILGGDHSTPLGYMRALSEKYERFGILQIDAHADLRRTYQGFTYSHACIMHHALKIPAVTKLVQVGIRDYCEEELSTINKNPGRIKTFFDEDLKEQLYNGTTWNMICSDIIEQLPAKVYMSFDIDGLDPTLCPHTGTPVAGGIGFEQMVFLLKKIVASGRTIIGFDLCEVAPGPHGDWDANVGARILFQLANYMVLSNQ